MQNTVFVRVSQSNDLLCVTAVNHLVGKDVGFDGHRANENCRFPLNAIQKHKLSRRPPRVCQSVRLA